MTALIIGNIVALIASILMVYSGMQKNKKKILLFQTIQISLSILSNIILGGITGAIINTLSLIRNVLCYNNKLNILAKIIISFLDIVLCFKFNNLGILGLFPLISTLSYIWLMTTKDVKKLKVLIIFTMLLWGVYDICIKSYTSALFDFATIIANLITLFTVKENKNVKQNVK